MIIDIYFKLFRNLEGFLRQRAYQNFLYIEYKVVPTAAMSDAISIVWVGGIPWPQTGETQYHAQLELWDKGRALKGLVVCNNWVLEPLDLLNGPALGCYQPSPEEIVLLLSSDIDLM